MASKPTRARQEGPIDLADIRALAKLLNQYDLSELELDRNGVRLRLRRERSTGVQATVVAQPVPVVTQPSPIQAEPVRPAVEEPADDGSVVISSPFVGTFYRAPGPEAAPFVEVGQPVKKGQVLCIVEAMKLMNEIEAEQNCEILEALVENAEPVEFGQALFRVMPRS
jgi:acetyl-CoA carboxylase biotin carboxyl carrier protein